MNLNDLRAELDTQVSDARHGGSERLAAVRGKVRSHQRRRAAGVGAVAVVAAAAIIVPQVWGGSTATAPAPADDRRTPRPVETVPDPMDWPASYAGSRLLAEKSGSRDEIRLAFTPEDTNLEIGLVCRGDDALRLHYSINDHYRGYGDCNPRDSAEFGASYSLANSPTGNRDGWAALGVGPGEQSLLRAWVGDARRQRLTDGDVRIGAAVYERGPQVAKDGVYLDKFWDQDGRLYELTLFETQPVSERVRAMRTWLPASQHRRVLVTGSSGHRSSATDTSLDGEIRMDLRRAGGYGGGLMKDSDPHLVEVREVNQGVDSGVLLIAVYELVE